MRRIILLMFLFCLVSSPCLAARGVKRSVKKGNKLYDKGKFKQAQESYAEALSSDPDSDIVNFNLGGALYKTQDYQRAIGHFEQSLVSDEESLQQNASYNVANSKYRYGITKENTELEKALRVADFLELGELMARDALNREESAGGHFREEYQTPDGEAKRNDKDFMYVAAWEYPGDDKEPILNKEELKYEAIEVKTRDYKTA